MITTQEQTAILIFANSSQEEVSQKNIYQGTQLFDYLNEQIIHKVVQTGLPYVIFSEKEQQGATFGERFANAIAEVFAKGFTKVITLGNDSPHLTKGHILAAANQLEHQQHVIGPSLDGGTYLIGLHKEVFDQQSFMNLPWQTSQVQKAVISYITTQGGTVHVLPVLRDLDDLTDIKQFLQTVQLTTDALIQILLQLLKSVRMTIFTTPVFIFNTITRQLYNKGSPLV